MTKVLLVEDEAVLREAFTILLQAQSFEVDAAVNGQEALRRCAESEYDIILLDIMMPILDGIGFLEQANLTETAPHTQVLVLSNMTSGDQVNRALELGAHRHEIKSDLAPMELVKTVTNMLSAQPTV